MWLFLHGTLNVGRLFDTAEHRDSSEHRDSLTVSMVDRYVFIIKIEITAS